MHNTAYSKYHVTFHIWKPHLIITFISCIYNVIIISDVHLSFYHARGGKVIGRVVVVVVVVVVVSTKIAISRDIYV